MTKLELLHFPAAADVVVYSALDCRPASAAADNAAAFAAGTVDVGWDC